ncbi:zinc finger BED domain-containing protein 1-like [Rhizophagus clarus]|uniref:Zinc finger BED domain-containing protein 1-like n=2 Tax=Rhizophagus clarus TaxID=94130 RepID=A0A8H3QXY6_9GLOM|nr:zinc finger BED domain-containing protein 1-like [Rhizophagus clarus]
MDNSDVDSNYTSEDESEYSFGNSSQHSTYSLEMHRNKMILDDDNTNQQELDNEGNEDDEHQSNRTPSDVWKYIDKVTDPENPKCKICNKRFSAKSSTTTLRNHIKKYHKHIHRKANQTTLKFKSNITSFYDKEKNSEFVKLLIKWIVIDMLPFSLVDSIYFIEFIQKLNPKFKCPGCTTLKNEVMFEFNSRRERIIDFVKNIPGRFSITTDIWSSIKNEAFIGVTIHFITNEWKLKHFTLEVLRITGSHTGNAIYEILNKLLEDFDLKQKVISVTTDNGSNMIVACRLLKNDFDAQTPALDFIHSRCICHILNLAVNAGLKYIENLIKKLRKIVKSIRRTQLYLEELERLAIAANHTFKHPILDIKTRWNSTFLMAERILTLKEDLSIIKSRHQPLQDIWLNEREWEKFNLLSQFHIATTELSTQTYPTIAYARVVLLGLLVDLNENRNTILLVKFFWQFVIKFKNIGFTLIKMTHVLAFFDPRYKTIAYKNLEINEILEPIRNNFPDSALSNLPSNNSTSIFVQRLSSVRQQRNANTDELLKYWESADASFDIEPLSWWHAHSTEYPILSKMAQNYLSVQASSVPCEQLFSLAGNVVSKKRNRLDKDTTRACLCLRSWMIEGIE